MYKQKILFITNRNIINTCGELRLIKNRAESLYKRYNYSSDFLLLTHKKSINPEVMNVGGTLKIFRYYLSNPITLLKAKKNLKKAIRKSLKIKNYHIIIISGSGMLPLVKYIQNISPQSILIADCHGANEELIEFDDSNKLKTIARHQMFIVWKQNERRYLPLFDHILVVSNGLKKYLKREYFIFDKKIHVVPCAIKNDITNFEKLNQQRKKAREKYGIQDDEILFIYSGGTSKWQCIDETVEIFKCIHSELNNSKLLLLSGNKKYISKFKSNNVICDSLEADEVGQILPAGDFAFLLRRDFVTNHVAYPNKFLEYVVAGVKIISTPFVEDIAESVVQYKLGYILQDVRYEDKLIKYIKENKNSFGKDFSKREKLLQDVNFENRLRFIEKI